MIKLWGYRARFILACLAVLAIGVEVRSAHTVSTGTGTWGRPAQPLRSLTPRQRLDIEYQIQENRALLLATGRLSAVHDTEPVLFSWPLASVPDFLDPGYHTVSAFVDHDPAYPSQVLDYNCGSRTFDMASGYNHQGTDYVIWPYPWRKMDLAQILVVSMAPGVIVHKADGNYDRNCAVNSLPWNAVYVQHADGVVVWYGHLKKGSTTPKEVGEVVARGEYLGVVGASGNATGPHLHVEVRDSLGRIMDPYGGPCQEAGSLWQQQRPYYDSGVLAFGAQREPPEFKPCSEWSLSHQSDHYQPGDQFCVTAYLRDQDTGQVSQYTVYRPDGTEFASGSSHMPLGHSPVSYWYQCHILPQDAELGTWRMELEFAGSSYEQTFQVGFGSPGLKLLLP